MAVIEHSPGLHPQRGLPVAQEQDGAAPSAATAEHLRGSSLLLAGRFLAYGLEFIAQVLLVRYLAKSDFGAFSYALSVVVVLKSIAILELPNTLARFLPLYRERRDYGSLMGSVALAVGAIAGVAGLLVAGTYLAVGPLGFKPTDDPQALLLLLALGLLVPLEGLDALATALLATLAGAAPIAFRQVLASALKLGVVLALLFAGADVYFLATGYVAVSALGLLVYAWSLLRTFRRQAWLPRWRPRQLSFPVREIFGFALPLLASTLVWVLMESADAILLGFFQNSEAVANFRAVLPLPRVLATLTLTFGVLYTPLAARLYARGEHEELADLYRRVALWMTVLSFPIFALTFAFARATTIGLYGARYADAAPIMALLALGYYCFALTGFNGLTLKIYRQLRFAVSVDIAAAVINLAVNLVLIPRWGAVGAAVGTGGTMVVHNLLKQYGLWRYLGINLFQRRYIRAYAGLLAVALALLGLQLALPASLWVALPLSAVASLLVLWLARASLALEAVFPELQRWPWAAAIARTWLR